MEQNKKDFIQALRLLADSLNGAAPLIDELNGRMEEIRHYTEFTGDLDDETIDTLGEIEEFYMSMPVFDGVKTWSETLEEGAEYFEEKQKGDK